MNVLLVTFIILTMVSASPLQDFIKSNNLFTSAIYGRIAKKYEGNVLVSPLSLQVHLAIMQSGAKSETAEEIRQALQLPSSNEKIELAIKIIISMLNTAKNHKLHIANNIYLRENLPIKQQFKKTVGGIYQTNLQNIDFSQNLKAASMINKWIEEDTNNNIHNIVNSDDINSKTVAILVNAVSFKGIWVHGFSKKSATKEKFYKSPENVIEVDTMHGVNRIFKYYNDKELKAKFLELPLNGRDLSMVLILPNNADGITDLEHQSEKLFHFKNFEYTVIDIAIPKFKINSTLDLKDTLISLGMKRAFKSGEADFSGISGKKGQLYINNVIQKISIAIDESYAEAAANARSGLDVAPYASPHLAPPNEFIANRPFLFYIKMRNIILFGGRISTPEQ